jgi:hypothetical protein
MTDFATLTNPELNRWAAERDDVAYAEWYISVDGGKSSEYSSDKEESVKQFFARLTPNSPCGYMMRGAIYKRYPEAAYADRADLAIALLGRWGYQWTRGFSYPSYTPFVEVSNRFTSHRAHESPDCDTARALVIAACALKEMEAQ